VKLNRLDLNKFHAFTVAARTASFSRAAVDLGLSRSAVSQAIAGLESSLGVRLFDRVGRRTFLSEPGRQLLDVVADYQLGLERGLGNIVATEPARLVGVARLGLFIGFSNARLAKSLAAFLDLYPRAAVKVAFLPHAELAARLLDRKLDAALSVYSLTRHARLVEATRLLDEKLVLVSGARHHLRKPTLQQVRELPFVDYHETGELARSWIRFHYRTDPGALRIRAHVAAVDLVLEMVRQDVGVGIVPFHVVRPFLETGELKVIHVGRTDLSDSIWLNQVRGLVHSAPGARLIETLVRSFRQLAAHAPARPAREIRPAGQ
jgi:DNA-binding transcriptional LysR family regulator